MIEKYKAELLFCCIVLVVIANLILLYCMK